MRNERPRNFAVVAWTPGPLVEDADPYDICSSVICRRRESCFTFLLGGANSTTEDWSSSTPGSPAGRPGSTSLTKWGLKLLLILAGESCSSSLVELSAFSLAVVLAPDAAAEAALSASSRAAPTCGTSCVNVVELPIVRLLRWWKVCSGFFAFGERGLTGGFCSSTGAVAFGSRSCSISDQSTGIPARAPASVVKKADCSSLLAAHDISEARSLSRFRFVVSATCCCRKAFFRAFQSPWPLKQLYSCFQNRMASIQYWFQAARTGSACAGQAPFDTSAMSWMQVRTTVWASRLCTYSSVHCWLPRRYL
mmetsp:Transcript_34324/g.74897  ORF Transcript_34324/g.74897 Transcript_34324/m.74897 type:complete len:308 (-) Transcript_34324:1188-2111(-)